MAQITYTDKTALNINGDIADTNKVNASDMNEIKSVVNGNYNEVGNITNLTTTNKTSVVNAINEVNEKNILCVGLSDNTNVRVSATWTYYNLNLDTTKASIGNKLTFNSSTHRITVGDGVSYVRISTFASIRGIQNSMEYAVRKNTSPVGVTNFQGVNTNTYYPSAISNVIVPVSSGDYFDVTLRSAGTGTIVVAGNNNYSLTIEAIS
jgi:hypothetical protein